MAGCVSRYPCYIVQVCLCSRKVLITNTLKKVDYTTIDGTKQSADIYESEGVLLHGRVDLVFNT